MIFVTVGTHEQQFNRLVECVDSWAQNTKEKVIIQTGFCTFVPQNCEWKKLYSHDEMSNYYKEARIIITHGGPSSFITPLILGKIPIVFPRKKEFKEHVNDHQVFFSRYVAKKMNAIIEVEENSSLLKAIDNYDDIIKNKKSLYKSNNQSFCYELDRIVKNMF